jgi:hemoglobin
MSPYFLQHKEGMMEQRGVMSAVVISLVLMAGCATAADSKGKSLYDRLGGKGAITAVVETFVGNVGGDTRINGYFATTDLTKLKMHLVNQICEASGGPCKYTGRSMKQTHAGMGVDDAAFHALVDDLVKALDHHKVGKTEKDDLLGVLGPMKSDIVEKK